MKLARFYICRSEAVTEHEDELRLEFEDDDKNLGTIIMKLENGWSFGQVASVFREASDVLEERHFN